MIGLHDASAQPGALQAGMQHLQQRQMTGGNHNPLALGVVGIRAHLLEVERRIFQGEGNECTGLLRQLLDQGVVVQPDGHCELLLHHQGTRQRDGYTPSRHGTAANRPEQGRPHKLGVNDPAVVQGRRRQWFDGPGADLAAPLTTVCMHQPDEWRGNFHPQQ
ncbi:hypothetical protein D3C78_1310650 [compost metagenome]